MSRRVCVGMCARRARPVTPTTVCGGAALSGFFVLCSAPAPAEARCFVVSRAVSVCVCVLYTLVLPPPPPAGRSVLCVRAHRSTKHHCTKETTYRKKTKKNLLLRGLSQPSHIARSVEDRAPGVPRGVRADRPRGAADRPATPRARRRTAYLKRKPIYGNCRERLTSPQAHPA